MNTTAPETSPTTDTADSPLGGGAPRRTPPAAVKLVGMSAALGAVLVVLLGLFILPSLKAGPHDLVIGVVGTPEATTQLEAALELADPEAFDPRSYDSEAELVVAVEEREVVGGFVLDEGRIEAMVASAGSTAISGTLTATADALGDATGAEVEVTDVVALPADDPTGVGVGGLAFPLVFGGIVPVVAFRAMFPRSSAWRLSGLVAFSLVGGALVASVLAFWFGSVAAASFWPVAGSMALGIASLAFPLAGLQQLFGGKGFTVGAMTMMFLGNPFSGIATTGAWLPAGIGTFGQVLPPGAAGALVRSAAYFDGGGGLVPGLTLATWVLVGLALHTLGVLRSSDDEAVATEDEATP